MNAHQARLTRNIRLLFLHAGFLNMLFIIPVIVPFYREVIGLSFRQFMIGEAAFSATILLMEVPTGWLSDVWTRKAVMLMGTVCNIAGEMILGSAHSFAAATAAQMVIGVSVSLLSGTNSALLYESLLGVGEEARFRKLEGLRFGIGLYASGACAVAGGFLYRWSPEAPIVGTWATSIVALLFIPFMQEPQRHKAGVRKHPLADMADTLRYAFSGHADIAGIILFSGLLFAVTKMMFWSQQPFFLAVQLPVSRFGLFTACGMLLGGVSGHLGHRLDGRLRDLTVVMASFALACGLCLICGMWPSLWVAPLLVASSVIFGVASPRVQAVLSRKAPPERRATVLSTASFTVHLFSIPLLVLTGWMTDHHGIDATLLLLAGLAGAAGLAMAAIAGRKERAMR